MLAETPKSYSLVASPRFLTSVLAFSAGAAKVARRPFAAAFTRAANGGSQASETDADHAYWTSIARGY